VTPERIVTVIRFASFCWASIVAGAVLGAAYRWMFVGDYAASDVLFLFGCLCLSVFAVWFNTNTLKMVRGLGNHA
jgi:hypothetical protein